MKRKQFFGEYLIGQGLVTDRDVLEALAEQKRHTPSFENTAIEYGLLSMKQVFAILTHQAASDLSFEQIALREGYLDAEQVRFIDTSIQRQRKGVGEILVDMGRLSVTTMQSHLTRFHEAVEAFREIEALLTGVELFRHLDANALRTLGSIATRQLFDPGQVLMREGEPADSLYAIVSGYLRVTKDNPTGSGEPVYLSNLGPDEFVGEACIFRKARRSANVITETRAELIRFDRGDFVRFLRDHAVGSQSLFIQMINGLLDKLEFTSSELSHERKKGLSQDSVEELLERASG